MPCLAGLGKNPGMKLTRASTWTNARSRNEREKGPSIWVHLPHIGLALPRGSQQGLAKAFSSAEERKAGPMDSGSPEWASLGTLPHHMRGERRRGTASLKVIVLKSKCD